MRHIKLRIYAYAFISVLCAAACVLLIVFDAVSSGAPAYLLLAVMFSASVVSAIICICESEKLKIVRLISENPILQIRTVFISDISCETAQPENSESIEVIVSYFGILMAEKIVKFNQEGIRLRAVEIGKDFISFTCGTEKRTQNIRLLCPTTDPAAMERVCERFRYETGITPTLLS